MSHLNLWGLRICCWGEGRCLQLSSMLMFLQEWNRDTQIFNRISRYSTVTWFLIFFISSVLLLICIQINPLFFAVPQGPAQAVKLPRNKRRGIDHGLTKQRPSSLASTWAGCKTTASQMSACLWGATEDLWQVNGDYFLCFLTRAVCWGWLKCREGTHQIQTGGWIVFHFMRSRTAVILTCTSGMGLVMKETARMTMAESAKRISAK